MTLSPIHFSAFRIRKLLLPLVTTLGLLLSTPDASAALYALEDFSYPSGSVASGTNSGGSGWSGAWGGNTSPTVLGSSNLSITSTGYSATQTGVGEINSGSGLAGVSSRSLANPILGAVGGNEVWFSVLVQTTDLNARSGFYMDISDTSSTASRSSATAGFLIVNNQLRTLSGGTLAGSGPALLNNTAYLMIGRISLLDTGMSTISLWAGPDNVTSVGSLGVATATFTANFSGSITNFGVEAYSNALIPSSVGIVDALRIGSDLQSVVTNAIPEPSYALILGALGVVGLLSRARRQVGARQ